MLAVRILPLLMIAVAAPLAFSEEGAPAAAAAEVVTEPTAGEAAGISAPLLQKPPEDLSTLPGVRTQEKKDAGVILSPEEFAVLLSELDTLSSRVELLESRIAVLESRLAAVEGNAFPRESSATREEQPLIKGAGQPEGQESKEGQALIPGEELDLRVYEGAGF